MQFGTIFFTLALAVQGLAGPTPGTEHSLIARKCAGSTVGCRYMSGDACDFATNHLNMTHTYSTGGPTDNTGNAQLSNGFGGGCGIFVEKVHKDEECNLKGSQMKEAREQMKKNGCGVCGEVTVNDKCKVKADYVAPH